MAEWRYQEDWERRKKYLIRSLFAEPPVLSPIQECQESSSESPSPVTPPFRRRVDRDSPLPELIIEPEKKRRHDCSEKYYDKLENKMKKYYRKLFYGEEIDIGSSISEDNESDVINESPTSARSYEEHNETGIESVEGTNKDDASNGEHIHEGSDKTSEPELDRSIARSEVPNDTPNSPLPSLTSDMQIDFQDRQRKSPDELETELLSELSSNSPGKVETVLVKAMVHSTEDAHQGEPEQMRRQKPSGLGEVSFQRLEDAVETQRPSLNIAQLSVEQLSESTSTLNNSVPMDLLSESFPVSLRRKRSSIDHPFKKTITSTTQGSPIILPSHISTKRKKYNPVETNSVMTQTELTEHKTEREVQTELNSCDAANQCNIHIHANESIANRNAAVQTDNIGRDQNTQTDQIRFGRIFIDGTINFFV